MNKKILFLDVDGTIVDYSGNIPESAILAIQKARENGHLVYMSTGRSRSEVYPSLWEIGFDGMIGGNGSYVEHQEQVVMHQVISEKDSHHIVDWLHMKGLEFYLESNSGLYASEHFETRGQPTIQQYSAGKGNEHASELTIRDVFPDMLFGKPLYRTDLNKVSFILESYQDYLEAVTEFPHLKVGTWGGKGEHALFGDLALKDITKGNAIHKLLDHLNLDIEHTIAFGDAVIDIPMFEVCSESCCMGSGGDEAKKAATYVTTDVDKDGLYNAFKHFNLI